MIHVSSVTDLPRGAVWHAPFTRRKGATIVVTGAVRWISVWHEFPAMPVGSSGVIQLWVLEHVQELRKRNFWLAVFAFIVEVVAYVE